MTNYIQTDTNGRKYIVNCCDRCGKIVEGIHTCSPNLVIESLRQQLAVLQINNTKFLEINLENEQLHQQLAEAQDKIAFQNREHAEMQKYTLQLERNFAEAQKDAERLDWLASHGIEALEIFGQLKPSDIRFVRQDIDKAMEQSNG